MGYLYKKFEKVCYKGIHEANKAGIRRFREEVAKGNMSKEQFNKLYLVFLRASVCLILKTAKKS